MKLCEYCGAKIDWNSRVSTWVEVETDEIHYCPKTPGKKPVADNDNIAISKMLESHAALETLKPAQEKDQINKLSRDLYSLDGEFQDYKRKTDKRISELESRIERLTSDANKTKREENVNS